MPEILFYNIKEARGALYVFKLEIILLNKRKYTMSLQREIYDFSYDSTCLNI